jgi:hypothetical protein
MIAPYTHYNVLMTGTTTGWMNWHGLRLDTAADPIVRALAEKTWIIWNESQPRFLESYQWHLPYADDGESADEVYKWVRYIGGRDNVEQFQVADFNEILKKLSVARCAHLSYESFETGARMGVEQCLKVVGRLFPGPGKPIHASPFEHQSMPDNKVVVRRAHQDFNSCPWLAHMIDQNGMMWANGHLSGNLLPGWIQNRKLIAGESIAPLPEKYKYKS